MSVSQPPADDYDLTLEDPLVEDGDPLTPRDFARDANIGVHPDDRPTLASSRAVFGEAIAFHLDRPAVEETEL